MEDIMENENNIQQNEPEDPMEKIEETLESLREDVNGLKDLFTRRLYDDKQKSALISKMEAYADYAFIEPFISDLILLLDRLEKAEDEFSVSVSEELYEILNRRGVERIITEGAFDPSIHKAVRIEEREDVDVPVVSGVIRNGYTLAGRVIRAAEVIVAK